MDTERINSGAIVYPDRYSSVESSLINGAEAPLVLRTSFGHPTTPKHGNIGYPDSQQPTTAIPRLNTI